MISRTLIISLLISSAYASKTSVQKPKYSTSFQWAQKSKIAGECYEVDSKTMGELYSNKVKSENCSPTQSGYIFDTSKGLCYLVDSLTKGKNFTSKVKPIKCKTDNVSIRFLTINGKKNCFEHDVPSRARKYYRKVKASLCHDDKDQYFWKPLTEYKGECYVKHSKTDFAKVSDESCKPEKVKLVFKRESSFKGSCYEQDVEDSRRYSRSLTLTKCKPEKTYYTFSKGTKSLQGQCYEVDSKTSGDKYIQKVNTSNCK